MKVIDIIGQSSQSKILINERLTNVSNYINHHPLLIITDKNVHEIYKSNFPNAPVIQIGIGEKIKTLKTIEHIYQQMIDLEVDRSWFVLGIGGGIVCDITGFVASTYMRGLPFGFISTTLLSQVDASVGGKNGVNFYGYKNMIGVFNQPSFVLCDPLMLKTLPKRELICGFAEVIKHAVIADPTLFSFLHHHYHQALNLEETTMERIIYDCIAIKANIVQKDEKEKGERRILNFGHTLGHALEKITGIPHGEAVSMGISFAVTLSKHRNLLEPAEANQIIGLLSDFLLPVKLTSDKEKIREAIKKDKKREGKSIHFILLEKIGKPIILDISFEELEAVINDLC